jgi:hypothetical protein
LSSDCRNENGTRGWPLASLPGLHSSPGQGLQFTHRLLQAEQFKKTIHCTGTILPKLDGTAKGGAIFAIKQKIGLRAMLSRCYMCG